VNGNENENADADDCDKTILMIIMRVDDGDVADNDIDDDGQTLWL